MADYIRHAPSEQVPPERPPFHESTMPDGRPWMACHRGAGGYLLRFPGVADFRVSGDGREASCTPAPGTPTETCEHLYLNQVLPRMLSRQGKLVFHASAVALGEGAVAFLAASGRGKSTLAAAFAASGARFLTDDGMVLDEAAEGYRVLPSHPSIRLREDSRRALTAADAGRAGVSHAAVTHAAVTHAAKMRLPADALLPHCAEARPLRAAYFLGPGEARAVALGRLGGAEALAEWLRHAFVLDVDDRDGLAAHFAGVSGLPGAVPCFRLDYPRRFEELGRLRQTIADHAGALEPDP